MRSHSSNFLNLYVTVRGAVIFRGVASERLKGSTLYNFRNKNPPMQGGFYFILLSNPKDHMYCRLL